MSPIRALMIDDHRMFADLVTLLLEGEPEVELIGTAATGEEGIDVAARSCPDVVVLDIDLPGMDGIETARRIRERCPDVAVVVVTGYQEEQVMARAIEAGARAYVPKTRAAEELVHVIRRAAAGEMVLPSAGLAEVFTRLQEARVGRAGAHRLLARLTSREIEVLQALAEGMATGEVARTLYISPHTVQGHVKNILSKLEVRSKLEAVTLAVREGLIRLRSPGE